MSGLSLWYDEKTSKNKITYKRNDICEDHVGTQPKSLKICL